MNDLWSWTEEYSCAAYAFGAGVVAGDTDGCTDGYADGYACRISLINVRAVHER